MSIKLTDAKNWSADLAGSDSLLDKAKLVLTGMNLAGTWNTPVNSITPKDLGPGTVSFAGSTPLPFAGSVLSVNASQGAAVGGQVAGSLFGSADAYDQPVSLADKCCLWVQLNGTLQVGAAGSFSGFGIGIRGDSYAQYRFTQIFQADAAGQFPPLSQAMQTLFQGATPPVDLAALQRAPVGSAYELDCGGSVKLSASYSLPTSTLPLATANLPIMNQQFVVAADPSVSLSGSFEVRGSFLFRVHRLDNNIARFHLFKKSGTTVEVSFDASAGATAGVGGMDFLAKAFKAISPDCHVDLSSRDAAVNDQLADILQEAVSSHLSASVNAEATRSSSLAHIFTLDIDLQVAQQSPEMTRLVNGLFHGDWTLARKHEPAYPCVKSYSDLLEQATSTEHAFRFHLLNLFSFASVTDFLASAKVLQSPDGVVFTDNDTASRIQATANGRIADPMSLSKVLAQALEATLAFKTGTASPALVDLSIAGKYFNYEKNASRDDLQEIALLSAALDCSLTGLQTDATRVGVVQFDASSVFGPGASEACFIGAAPDFTPKDEDVYSTDARRAIASLYDASHPFHAAAVDPTLWTELDEAGSLSAMMDDTYVQNFLRAHGGFDGNPGNLSQIMWLYGIWYTVTFWSRAMAKYAQLLQKAKKLAAQLPPGSRQQTPEIQGLMRQLSSAMHDAQAQENNFIDARAQFGLVALYLCSGKTAANDVCLVWNGVTASASNRAALSARVG